MSYPADGLPRFKFVAIGQGGPDELNNSPRGYVYDRAFCHRPVCVVPARTKREALARAEAIAARLNVDPTLTARELLAPWRGRPAARSRRLTARDADRICTPPLQV